jgi:hypothetical protein
MKVILDKEAMGARLPVKCKTKALQSAAHFLP